MPDAGWSRMSERQSEDRLESALRAAAHGDGDAFAFLYERMAPRVKAFGLTRRVDDADALANDVMLKVFQNLGAFTGDTDAFVSWVFTIARNRIIDLHRAAARRPALSGMQDAGVEPVPNRSAEAEALDVLGLEWSLELLGELTDDQREVVALRMIADLSLEQVASIVDRPITAVKALQRRGLARLQREILDQEVSS